MGSSGQRHNLPSHFLLSPPPSEYRIRARTPGHCALRVLLLEVGRARAELGTGHYTGQVRLLVLQCYISTASHLQGWTFRIEIHGPFRFRHRYSYSLYRAYCRRTPFLTRYVNNLVKCRKVKGGEQTLFLSRKIITIMQVQEEHIHVTCDNIPPCAGPGSAGQWPGCRGWPPPELG